VCEELTVRIDPLTADIICRNALKEYAREKGIKRVRAVVNWHWYLNKQHLGLNNEVVFIGEK
jgi:hypothetical protein